MLYPVAYNAKLVVKFCITGTLLMLLLLIFRVFEQITWLVDLSVRLPVVALIVKLHPATVLTLEMLNPLIFKNPMFDNTMLPPVVDERTRLLFP